MRKDSITYADFAKLDLRVGTIKNVEPVPNSQKLLKLIVNLGEDYGATEILSGIAQYYTPDELIGKQCIFLANLEPKPMAGLISNGMLIAINDATRPILLEASGELADGLEVC